MAHELSQSDGICDWWNDYHYGYNHADTSPWYLVAMGDYVRTSGDVEFLKQSWESVKKAYEWCLSKDSDHDGLMDLKGSGLGALEFGKLVGIYADLYTCGIFVQGVKEMKYMAELVGDNSMAAQAKEQLKKAEPRLEELFWLEKEGYYAYGATEKGERVNEKTPWSGIALMFGLMNEKRAAKNIEALNGADMCTDWGMRTMSNKSEFFEPTNYNYGAVWPFISSFFNTSQFKYRYSESGYQLLRSTIKHAFDHALGTVPEVFSGELNEKLGEGYHHQGFSTTGYLLPLVRGLLGLERNSQLNQIDVKPGIPLSWDSVTIKNLVVGSKSHNLIIRNDNSGMSLDLKSKMSDAVAVDFQPLSIANQDLKSSHVNAPEGEMRVSYLTVPMIQMLEEEEKIGMKNNGLRIVSLKLGKNKITYMVEGLAGETYRTPILNPETIKKVDGANIENNRLIIFFDDDVRKEFTRKEIVIGF
jgi:hypothetical protein